MPRRKITPQIEWVEPNTLSVANAPETRPASSPSVAPAPHDEPVKAIPAADVPRVVSVLRRNLEPGGKWSTKPPDWVTKLLLFTIDCLAVTISQQQ